MKSGNQLLYCLFLFFNTFIMLEGILLAALGIFLYVKSERFGIFEIVFVSLGVLEGLLSILG